MGSRLRNAWQQVHIETITLITFIHIRYILMYFEVIHMTD